MDSVNDQRRFRCVGSVHVPAVAHFEAASAFIDANKIIRMSEAFTREMRAKIEERIPEAVLTGYELLRDLKDENTAEIVPGTLFLAHFLHLLRLPLKEAMLLRIDGLNVAYIIGLHGDRCAVSAEWRGKGWDQGWHVHAVDHYARVCGLETDNPWSGPHQWPVGTRFIT